MRETPLPPDPAQVLVDAGFRRPTPEVHSPPWWRQLPVAALVFAGHAALLWGLLQGSRPEPLPVAGQRIEIIFPDPEPPPPEPEPEPVPPLAPATPPAAAAAPRASAPATGRQRQALVAVEPTPAADAPLQLFRPDGSIDLPDQVREDLARVTADDRAFSFRQKGVMEAGTFMDRQPVLVYEATRFDRYWRPEQDMLTALLEAAVEATTGEVEIPIPGSPGSKVVCKVSILAMGGACGILDANAGYWIEPNDPATLNAEEDRQCQAWWDQIVAATDQDGWRATRRLYEAQCRKPLESDPPQPPGP